MNEYIKKLMKTQIVIALVISFLLGLAGPMTALAATTPSLGAAASFGILGSTYTNTVAGTTIKGDLGYTTGPAVAPTVNGVTHVADATYNQAGTDQATALTNLNIQACTFTFAAGAIDLATDITHSSSTGVYTPGVYCTAAASAASIGAGGITLSGAGTYIFRINGALTTVANSVVTLAGGASASDVFWTPTAATTLGANSTFVGTNIDASGITIGSTVAWTGRALAFGGTVSTDVDTITVPGIAIFRVVKFVIGGTAVASNFTVHVKNASGTEIVGSPLAGVAAPGTPYALTAGTYTVSEDANSNYLAQTFTGACNSSGTVTLASGDDKTCTIVNTYSSLVTINVAGRFVPVIGILKVPTPLALPAGSGSVTYNYTVWNVGGQQALTSVTVTDDKCAPVVLLSGDVNSNGKLDFHENWKYSCAATLLKTTTNTAIATGYGDDAYHQAAIATALATVVVGSPLASPIINIVKVPNRLTPFPFGGGNVTYSYIVTNPGIVPMNNVTVTDDKCAPVTRNFNDANLNGNNNNGLLDPGESWGYTCQTNISVSTRNVATAEGKANGFTAFGYAFATVLVSSPSLPNTGFPPQEQSAPWGIVILSGVFAASFLYVIRKKAVRVADNRIE